MIDLNKSLEFFDPSTVKAKVSIVGCGAVGSHLAVLLARLGVQKFALYDEDTVSSHNIANQNFVFNDIGRLKTECVAETIKAINPSAEVHTHGFAVPGPSAPSGYVFYCVDNIKVRKELTESYKITHLAKAIIDFRMGLTSGQVYVVTYNNIDDYMKTMNFTDEEVDALTPHSACGFELSVAYSIWNMVGVGVSEFVDLIKDKSTTLTTIIDTGNYNILKV